MVEETTGSRRHPAPEVGQMPVDKKLLAWIPQAYEKQVRLESPDGLDHGRLFGWREISVGKSRYLHTRIPLADVRRCPLRHPWTPSEKVNPQGPLEGLSEKLRNQVSADEVIVEPQAPAVTCPPHANTVVEHQVPAIDRRSICGILECSVGGCRVHEENARRPRRIEPLTETLQRLPPGPPPDPHPKDFSLHHHR